MRKKGDVMKVGMSQFKKKSEEQETWDVMAPFCLFRGRVGTCFYGLNKGNPCSYVGCPIIKKKHIKEIKELDEKTESFKGLKGRKGDSFAKTSLGDMSKAGKEAGETLKKLGNKEKRK